MEKILIIEDEKIIRVSIMEILKFYAYEVYNASNGKEGLEMVKLQKPDLILCDVMMPEMDGFGVLEELKKDPEFNTPFIFLTAKVQSDDIRKGMNLGADDYVFKPFKSSDLLSTIRIRLAKKKQLTQNLENRTKDLEGLVKLMIGHEFSTPMNGIVNMSKFISRNIEAGNDSDLTELCKNLDISSERLQSTFQKVRKLYEVQEMETSIIGQKEVCNTADLIVGIASGIAKKAGREKDLVIHRIEDTVLPMSSNLLFSAVYEIIENAFKFSDKNSKVFIKANSENGEYHIVVSDSGKTVSADQLSSYRSFHQFDREKNEQQGLGAGLALAMKITALYKGQVSFSDNEQGGISVTLTFKL